MKIHTSDVKSLLIKAIDDVIMPRSDGFKKFAIAFVIANKQNQIDQMVENICTKFADADGYIDIEKTFDDAKLALSKCGGKVELPYLGWMLDQDDIDVLHRMAKQWGKD